MADEQIPSRAESCKAPVTGVDRMAAAQIRSEHDVIDLEQYLADLRVGVIERCAIAADDYCHRLGSIITKNPSELSAGAISAIGGQLQTATTIARIIRNMASDPE
jgi:hypothetical protein